MSSLVAEYPMLSMSIWYNKDSLANIFSLVAVRKLYCVTMNTTQEAVMHVHVSDNDIMTFLRYQTGSTIMIPAHLIIVLINQVAIYFLPFLLIQ